MSSFEISPDLLGGQRAPGGAADAEPADALARAIGGIAPPALPGARPLQPSAEQRVAAQEEAMFRASSVEQLSQTWREQAEAHWDGFDPNEDELGDSYAGAMADAIDQSVEETGRKAPSVAAEQGLRRDVEEAAEAGKRAALLRERSARLMRARSAVARRIDALQEEAEREPERLSTLMSQADRLIGEHQPLLAGKDVARLRLSAHETLARRAIAGALAIDPQSAAGKLPGRAVLAREELAAWDGVARAMAEVQDETNRREWRRRFERDLKSIGDSGEPGFELVEWIAEASGGAEGRIGPRLKQAEALADRLVLAREEARQAHRAFKAAQFGDFSAELEALDKDGEDDDAAGDDGAESSGLDDEGFWRQAQDRQTHLKRLRGEQARRLRANPAATAFEHPLVRRAWDKGDAEGAIAQGLLLQKRMGVAKPLPLPREHADALVQRLVATPPAELPALMESIKRAGDEHLAPLLAQLGGAGLPPSLALAGVLSGAAQAALLEARDAGAAPPAKPDAETVEQARAGFGETRLGLLLHRGAAKFGRDDPSWERAYRAAEAAVVQVGTLLARGEGEAGAARAALLLFGALDADRQALDRAATALGAPVEGRAGLYRLAGGKEKAAPEAASDPNEIQARGATDAPGGDDAPSVAAEEGAATGSPGDEGVVVGEGLPSVQDGEGEEETEECVIGEDGDAEEEEDAEALPFDPDFDAEMHEKGYDRDKARLLFQIANARPEHLARIKQKIDEVFGPDFMSRGSLFNFAQQLAQMAPDDPRRKVVFEVFNSDMRRPIDLPEWLAPFGPVLAVLAQFLGRPKLTRGVMRSGPTPRAKGMVRKRRNQTANPPRRYDDPANPNDPRFAEWAKNQQVVPHEKHHINVEGDVSPPASNAIKVFKFSFRVSPTSFRRIATDPETGELVIFHYHGGQFHAFAPKWDAINPKIRNAFIKNGLTDRRGRIIRREE